MEKIINVDVEKVKYLVERLSSCAFRDGMAKGQNDELGEKHGEAIAELLDAIGG